MTIFAIDPGPNTGIFWRVEHFEFQAATLILDEGHRELYKWLEEHVTSGDRIVLESFEYRKEYKDREYLNYKAAEYIGVVKTFAVTHRVQVIMQTASLAKGFWVDDKLKRIGVYKFCKTRHSRDAARHWLHYWTTKLGNQEMLFRLK
jgi:hypothetical protein